MELQLLLVGGGQGCLSACLPAVADLSAAADSLPVCALHVLHSGVSLGFVVGRATLCLLVISGDLLLGKV